MFLYHDTGRNELITSGNGIRKLFPSVFTKLSRQFFLFQIVINTFYCQPCYISRFFPWLFFLLGAFNSRSSGSGASRSQTASASLKNTIVPSTSMKRICSESAIFRWTCQNGSSGKGPSVPSSAASCHLRPAFAWTILPSVPASQEKALSADPYQTYSVVLLCT